MRKPTSALLAQLRTALQSTSQSDNFHAQTPVQSRRDFLRTTTAFGAGAFLLPQIPFLGNDKAKIAIVGGGLAGLTAAFYLKQKGIRATVYEADQRTGGRIRSAKIFANGNLTTELGGEFFNSDQTDLMQLVRTLGLERDLLDTSADTFGDRMTFFIGGKKYTSKDASKEFQNALPVLMADSKAVGAQGVSNKMRQLDNMSITEYLEKIPLSNWLKTLLNVAYTAENGLEASEQSALNLLSTIGLDEKFSLFPNNPRQFKIKGGNRRITEGLVAQLKDQVLVEQKLLAIREKKGGKTELVFNDGGFIKEDTFDAVILALPFTTLRQIDLNFTMPNLKREAILSLAYGRASKMFLEVNERTWRKHNKQGYSISSDFQSGWDSSHQQNGNEGTGVYAFQMGGYSADNLANPAEPMHKDQAKIRLSNLEDVFPESFYNFSGKSHVANWTKNELIRGSASSFGVGQYTTFAGVAQQPVGNIFFAGEHCSSDWAGTMNGAVESGRVAAEAILKKMGKV